MKGKRRSKENQWWKWERVKKGREGEGKEVRRMKKGKAVRRRIKKGEKE